MSEKNGVIDPEIQTPLIRGKQPYADFWCTTQMRTVKLSYMWTIKDFNKLASRNVDAVFSEEFFSNNSPHVKWQLVLKINSDAEQYFHLELNHLKDLSIPYKIFLKAKISILGADSEKRHYTTTFEGFSNEATKWEKKEFALKSAFIDQADDLLPRNSLVIFCEIFQSGYFNTQKKEDICGCDDRGLEDYSKFFENSLFSDAMIKVEGHTFNVHKVIIAARCPVFWAMFNPMTKMKEQDEGIAEISGITVKVFREILRYIYTGQVENINDIVCDLIQAADKFDLGGLKSICEKTMYDILSAKNAMEFLAFANKLDIKLWKEKILKFIKENLSDVITRKNWIDILDDNMDLATEILQMHIAD